MKATIGGHGSAPVFLVRHRGAWKVSNYHFVLFVLGIREAYALFACWFYVPSSLFRAKREIPTSLKWNLRAYGRCRTQPHSGSKQIDVSASDHAEVAVCLQPTLTAG